MLKENERLEDLDCKGLKIIQNSKSYCFTSDSVILANYVKATAKETIIDLCTGSGIIAILLSAKTRAKKIIAVELQEKLADLAQRNVDLNSLNGKIAIENISLQQAPKKLGKHNYDVVVCNPPYTKKPYQLNEENEISIARHEIKMTLEELIISASELLKFGGKFYFVHRVERLDEILILLNKYKLMPKELTFIYPPNKKEAYLVMFKCLAGGKNGIKVLQPINN